MGKKSHPAGTLAFSREHAYLVNDLFSLPFSLPFFRPQSIPQNLKYKILLLRYYSKKIKPAIPESNPFIMDELRKAFRVYSGLKGRGRWRRGGETANRSYAWRMAERPSAIVRRQPSISLYDSCHCLRTSKGIFQVFKPLRKQTRVKRKFSSTFLGFIHNNFPNKIIKLADYTHAINWSTFCIVGNKRRETYPAEEVKLVIKCTFLVPPESIRSYIKQILDSPPLPHYIIKAGPYVNNKGREVHQIIILYKFDKSKFVEAWENISEQLGSFCNLPGFTVSAHTYGPHPNHFTLEIAKEIKKYVDLESRVAIELRAGYEY